jgi:hypothetical protein
MFSQLGSLLSRAGLLLAGAGCFAGALLAYYKLHDHALTLSGEAIAFVVPVIVGILLVLLAVRLSAHRVRRLMLELVVLGVAVFFVEAGLTAFASVSPNHLLERAKVARKLGITFDQRSKSELVAELRGRGMDAYPGISRNWLESPAMKQRVSSAIYPLSQVSNALIVECNESGQYMTFTTDEYGFNNPPGLAASGRPQIAAVGSSYTLGHCVPNVQGFVGRVRDRYPRTLNFGMAGTYVLTDLATLREYIAPLRPRVVLWMMYPNALESDEISDPILARYVEPDFSQHLLDRRAEVDALLRKHIGPIQSDLDNKMAAEVADYEHQRWRRIPLLPRVRAELHDNLLPALKSVMYQPAVPEDLGTALNIIKVARDEVEGWGGKMVIVLIPTYEEVVANQTLPGRRNERVLTLLEPLHVHVINGVELFRRQHDPAGLYNQRSSNHFNEDGHRLLGEYIVADLDRTYPELLASSD